MKHVMHSLRSVAVVSVGVLSVMFLVGAALNPTRALTTISQSYNTEGPLSLGSIVSLENNTSDSVIAAATSNVESLLGVAINGDSSPLILSNGGENQVQVTTAGIAPVLVSDINGPIKQGDHITASPISGVGMKATSNIRIVGIAQGDLNDTLSGTTKQTYKDANGEEQTVTIGEIPVLVNVAYYFKEPDKTVVPSALQNLANALAGKEVSTVPIIISTAIFVIMLIVVVSIIYAMIRSSIISVGRNPMSQSAIYRDLIQLSALVLAILAVGLIAIYMILTRL